MQIIDTKQLFPRRIAVRKELAEEIRVMRTIAQIKRLPPRAKEKRQQKAKLLAKAFRNSQKKYGPIIAEERRDLALAIKQKREKLR